MNTIGHISRPPPGKRMVSCTGAGIPLYKETDSDPTAATAGNGLSLPPVTFFYQGGQCARVQNLYRLLQSHVDSHLAKQNMLCVPWGCLFVGDGERRNTHKQPAEMISQCTLAAHAPAHLQLYGMISGNRWQARIASSVVHMRPLQTTSIRRVSTRMPARP